MNRQNRDDEGRVPGRIRSKAELVSNLVSGDHVSRWKSLRRRWAQHALIFIAVGLGLDLYSGGGAGAGVLYSNGDVELRWDNTLKYGAAFRLKDRNADLLADPNADDGDRNFSPGIV